jgi:hypothetical protein
MHKVKDDCSAKLQSVAARAEEGVEYLRAILGKEGFGELNRKVDKYRAKGREIDPSVVRLLEANSTLREALGCFERAHLLLKPYAKKLVASQQ